MVILEDLVPAEVLVAKIATIPATVAARPAEIGIRFCSALSASTEVVVDVVRSTLPDAVSEARDAAVSEAKDAAVLEAMAEVIVAVLDVMIVVASEVMSDAALVITTEDRYATRQNEIQTAGGIKSHEN